MAHPDAPLAAHDDIGEPAVPDELADVHALAQAWRSDQADDPPPIGSVRRSPFLSSANDREPAAPTTYVDFEDRLESVGVGRASLDGHSRREMRFPRLGRTPHDGPVGAIVQRPWLIVSVAVVAVLGAWGALRYGNSPTSDITELDDPSFAALALVDHLVRGDAQAATAGVPVSEAALLGELLAGASATPLALQPGDRVVTAAEATLGSESATVRIDRYEVQRDSDAGPQSILRLEGPVTVTLVQEGDQWLVSPTATFIAWVLDQVAEPADPPDDIP